MICTRDTAGNIIGWNRQSLLDAGFTPTEYPLTTAAHQWEMRRAAASLNTPLEQLHAFRIEDDTWELFYRPGATPGAGYTEHAILP